MGSGCRNCTAQDCLTVSALYLLRAHPHLFACTSLALTQHTHARCVGWWRLQRLQLLHRWGLQRRLPKPWAERGCGWRCAGGWQLWQQPSRQCHCHKRGPKVSWHERPWGCLGCPGVRVPSLPEQQCGRPCEVACGLQGLPSVGLRHQPLRMCLRCAADAGVPGGRPWWLDRVQGGRWPAVLLQPPDQGEHLVSELWAEPQAHAGTRLPPAAALLTAFLCPCPQGQASILAVRSGLLAEVWVLGVLVCFGWARACQNALR